MAHTKRPSKELRNLRTASKMIEYLPDSVRDLMTINHLAKLTGTDTTDGQANANLADWLWANSQDLAQQALNTDFIQGIKSGLLDPNDYGGYTVQDAVYCYNATEYYKVALERSAGDAIMTSFLEAHIKTFTEYTESIFEEWHIANPSGIAMGKAASWYSSFERNVAETMEPYYLLIAMLPCEKLWTWLADQIKSGISGTNVYSFWIEENLQGSTALATFVNENADKYKVDPETAKEVYKTAMEGEVNFFASATLDSS